MQRGLESSLCEIGPFPEVLGLGEWAGPTVAPACDQNKTAIGAGFKKAGKATKVVATHSPRWVKSQAVGGGSPGPPLQHIVGCFVKFFCFFLFLAFCVFHALFKTLLVYFFLTCFRIFLAAAVTMKFLTADCLLVNVILSVQCDLK